MIEIPMIRENTQKLTAATPDISISDGNVFGRFASKTRLFLWRIGAIPYNFLIVSTTITLLARERVWNIKKV